MPPVAAKMKVSKEECSTSSTLRLYFHHLSSHIGSVSVSEVSMLGLTYKLKTVMLKVGFQTYHPTLHLQLYMYIKKCSLYYISCFESKVLTWDGLEMRFDFNV